MTRRQHKALASTDKHLQIRINHNGSGLHSGYTFRALSPDKPSYQRLNTPVATIWFKEVIHTQDQLLLNNRDQLLVIITRTDNGPEHILNEDKRVVDTATNQERIVKLWKLRDETGKDLS